MSDPRALIALLEWYEAVGVDAVVSEQPTDRLAAPATGAAAAGARETATGSGRAEGARHAAPLRDGPPLDDAPPAPWPEDGAWDGGGEDDPRFGSPPAGRAPPTRPPPRFDRPAPAVPGAAVTVPDETVVAAARAEAASAATLDDLRDVMLRFDGCNLKKTATQLVFADGNPAARVMLIGEAPGREEDLEGRPFVGRSGKLLDRMLAAIGLDRSSVYIANVVPWRPPGNRTPSLLETEICRPFLARQIELVDPAVLVSLGGAAAKVLAGSTDGILKLRGKWLSYRLGDRDVPCLATLHPAYLLRQPLQKRLAWRDFLSLKRKLDEFPP
jgi:uracil-DNA glycosylase family 4